LTSSLHLVPFVLPLLAEYREQHDALLSGEEIRDPPRHADDVQPQLEQAVPESSGCRHPQSVPALGEPIDVSKHRGELGCAQ
jgi:hypothetical protein